MEWDHENGIWKGNKAASVDDLPEPLYIFGYGSLMWRPGDVLGRFDSFACSCKGWARLFAQRSMDHRGTSAFPGFVATLVDAVHLPSIGFEESRALSDEFIGILFRIPQEDAHHVISELDFREKGGYHRHLIEVTVLQDTLDYRANTTFKALVYTGSLDNPNFCLLDHSLRNTSIVAGEGVAEVVSTAWGPSGANAAYLIHLAKYIRSKGLHDAYLFSLLYDVAMRMDGLWVYHLMLEKEIDNDRLTPLPATLTAATQPPDKQSEITKCDTLRLVGWGCNEAAQISPSLPRGLLGAAMELAHVAVDATNDLPLLPQIHAGGSHSALLLSGSAYIWGNGADEVSRISGVVGCALGHNHTLLLHSSGRVLAIGDNSYSQCMPNNGSPTPEMIIISYFCDAAAAAQKAVADCQSPLFATPHSVERVICLAAGLRHSALILDSGKLITWGDRTFSQCMLEPWSPPEGRVVHVACGAKHTVCVDSLGRMWSFGNNKYSQLGRNIEGKSTALPGCVELDEDVMLQGVFWSRVMCGWSHNVCRGVTQSGSVIFVCWGRCDMGQLPLQTQACSADPPVKIPFATRLAGLPSGYDMQEVWCGSEYTVAASRVRDGGHLWACGWGEHLNLGDGTDKKYNSYTWVAVINKSDRETKQASLDHVWPSAVAAGGAHCIAIAQTQMRDLCEICW